MIFRKKGKIDDNFYIIGSSVVPVFLLDGPQPVLFDGGFTALTRYYEQDIKEILKDRAPAYLFITHSHFDHVGAVSYFKNLWPDLQIGTHAHCADILSRPRAVNLIRDLNREAGKNLEKIGVSSLFEDDFESFEPDLHLTPDTPIRLPGGLSIVPLNTPGHTRDFMSYWIPEKKILIASEAVSCIEQDDYIETEFLVDYDAYIDSIKRLQQLNAKVLCTGHHACFTNDDVQTHILHSFEAAENFRKMAEKVLISEKGDIPQALLKIKSAEWDERPWPKQPESAYLLNTREKLKTILKRMTGTNPEILDPHSASNP